MTTSAGQDGGQHDRAPSAVRASPGLHVLAKPIGPVCDITCDYCFYLEKHALFGTGENSRMSDDVLTAYVRQYIAAQPTPVVEFVWHGGEPTLRGLDFFRRVVALQQPFRGVKEIRNALQTNGMRLTDDWCAFFKENNFFIGLSLDGPQAIHDVYRKGRRGQSTFDGVLRGLKFLQKHRVDYNILACVGKATAYRPLDVYRFFKGEGVEFIQFTPIIERVPDSQTQAQGLWLATPARLDKEEPNTAVTLWTVEPEKYGDFLIAIYEEWVRQDVGKIFVMNFEWALNAWIGNPSPVCIFAKQCGRAVALEHDGSLFACDHYVYPAYRLGNILYDDLAHMVEASVASGFSPHKERALPRGCRECEVLQACWGGCPKHRFTISPQGEPGLHYFCAGYKKFFMHIRKYLRAMTTLLEHGLPQRTTQRGASHLSRKTATTMWSMLLVVAVLVQGFAPAAWAGGLWMYQRGTPEVGTANAGVAARTTVTTTANSEFDDTVHVAVGAHYRVHPKWRATAGFAFDSSPVGDGDRTVSLPLDRAFRYSAGLIYAVTQRITMGLAYTFIDAGSAGVNQTRGRLAGTIQGEYSSNYIHVIGLSAAMRF